MLVAIYPVNKGNLYKLKLTFENRNRNAETMQLEYRLSVHVKYMQNGSVELENVFQFQLQPLLQTLKQQYCLRVKYMQNGYIFKRYAQCKTTFYLLS